MNTEKLPDIYFNSMRNPLNGIGYYLVTLKNGDKNSIIGIFSSWIDFDKDDKNKEIRQISSVIPDKVKQDLEFLEKPSLIVNSVEELTSFFAMGGYALVDKQLIDKHQKEILDPIVCSNTIDRGFIKYETLPQKDKARFARDKFRVEVIDRDNYRCRVCGCSEADSVHIRLEVHHIKPWEEGGLTIKENLITLCNACHRGAKNFDRWKLYEKIGISSYYQNSTFFSPNENYTSEQYKKVIYFASNTIEIIAPKDALKFG